MQTTRGPPNIKAGDLDPKGKGSIEKIVKRQESGWRQAIMGIWVTCWIYFKHLLDSV